MISLDQVVAFLDEELRTGSFTDYPGAMNGLQLTNGGKIGRVVAAVDASLPVIEEAAKGGPGLLVVHHGMFWQGAQPVTGAFYRKLKMAMDAGLAIYSSHLPLDVHPRWGNNILLSNALEIQDVEPFCLEKGVCIGLRGTWSGTRDALTQKLRAVLVGDVHLCPGGREVVSEVGIITGGAGSLVSKVAEAGITNFVTGEGPHWSYPLALELGVNVFYGGHYKTEVSGVQKVARVLSEKYGLPWEFLDHPTGL
jgi:dinuclear metal center YbgI/SA1388 family protein